MKGGCDCGDLRYEIDVDPIIVHACHCTWCQRETGGAFAVNALVETSRIKLLSGTPVEVDTPSASGRGQIIARCPNCHVAVWSHYSGAGRKLAFIRTGTLDHPHDIEPDIHIFTSTKRPWVVLPEGARSFPEFYDPQAVWPPEALARRAAAKAS
jgi:hypothetical protein